MQAHTQWEDKVVAATRRDINAAIAVLRKARDREDQELGPDGIGRRLGEIVDELLGFGD